MKQMYRLLVGLFALSMLAAGCYSEDSYQPSGTTLDVGAAPVADGTNRGLVQEGDSAPPPIATAVPAPAADESPEEGESDAEPEADEAASADGNCASAEFLCVGLVTDAGGQIDDNGFNQSAWEGVQSSVADQVDFVQTNDASEFEPNIQGFLDQDYDIGWSGLCRRQGRVHGWSVGWFADRVGCRERRHGLGHSTGRSVR